MKHKEPKKTEEQKQPELQIEQSEEPDRQVNDLKKEKEELFAKLQRLSADYTNFQKRTVKQIADTVCYEKEKIIKTLLPILDNFEHMLLNTDGTEDAETIIKGVRIIYDQMLDTLKLHGLEQIRALGEKFDPAVHQAIMHRPEPEQQEGIVLEEFQTGYKLNDRVIRPGRVVVNKLPSVPPVPEQKQDAADLQQQPNDESTDKD
jgi:molecular chaperone GrpE